jgi:tetratricopeptide (TPR) repeat protein
MTKNATVPLLLSALLWGCGSPTTLSQGRALMEKGRLEEACAGLEQLVVSAPDRGEWLDAIRSWVDCLSRAGELRRAPSIIARLPERGPRLYGRALVELARSPAGLPRAVELLARAEKSWPDEAEIPYRAGVLLLADDQAAAALPLLERAARQRDSAADAVARAHALLDLGRTPEALAQIRRVVGLGPTAKDLRRGRALIQRIARRTRTVPDAARERYREALDLLQRRDLAGQCVRKVEEILLDHPRLAAAHTLLGLAHLRLGNAAEAVVALRRAHELNPLDATNPLYLAVIYNKRGQAERSIKLFRRALELDPFLLGAARELGQLLLRQGRGREAAEVLDRVVLLDGSSASGRRMAGRAHMAAGALRRAERYFAKLWEKDRDDFELNLRLGQLLVRRAREERRPELLERARKHARRAAAVRPSDPEVEELRAQLAQAQRGTGRPAGEGK